GMLASLSLVSISLLPRDIIATIVGFPLFAVVVANIVNVVILSDFSSGKSPACGSCGLWSTKPGWTR
ncbi:hypothetical protein NZA98_04145, partial [Escherichia coli]|nr:hypothetical protein [Escherichia coli]